MKSGRSSRPASSTASRPTRPRPSGPRSRALYVSPFWAGCRLRIARRARVAPATRLLGRGSQNEHAINALSTRYVASRPGKDAGCVIHEILQIFAITISSAVLAAQPAQPGPDHRMPVAGRLRPSALILKRASHPLSTPDEAFMRPLRFLTNEGVASGRYDGGRVDGSEDC